MDNFKSSLKVQDWDNGFLLSIETKGRDAGVTSCVLTKEEAQVLVKELQKVLNETAYTKHLEQV